MSEIYKANIHPQMGHCYLGFHMTSAYLLPWVPVSYLNSLQFKVLNKDMF